MEKGTEQTQGLTYSTALLGDLVNKDTDSDGVLDWEEGLWGTDPTKKYTTEGIPDSSAVAKLKLQTGGNEQASLKNGESQEPENLTETDKFSREFFATVATLNQNGAMDQNTVDQLSSSLADHIQNATPRKIYALSEIKVVKDDSVQAVKNYDTAVDNIRKKYPAKGNVMDVLQKFVIDEDNVDMTALKELDPIIVQTKKIIDALEKTSVPQSLASLHLDFINGLERLVENISDIKLYEKDVIVALGGISQYEKNTAILETVVGNLNNTIQKKLNN